MKIPFLGLKNYLSKKIYPSYLIFGDEPYQIDYAYRKIINYANQNNIEVEKLFFESTLNSEQIYTDQSNFNLFSEVKIIALLFNKIPDKSAQNILDDLLSEKTTQDDKIYLIRTPKLNRNIQNKQWFQSIEKSGLAIQIWEPSQYKDTLRIIQFMLHDLNITADPEAINIIIEKTEGNLFSAFQLLQVLNLNFLKEKITCQDVEYYIENTAHYTIYDLVNAWLGNNKQRVNNILNFLRNQNTNEFNLIIWHIAKATRILIQLNHLNIESRQIFFKQQKIFKIQQNLYLEALNHVHQKYLYLVLSELAQLDALVKTHTQTTLHWKILHSILIEKNIQN